MLKAGMSSDYCAENCGIMRKNTRKRWKNGEGDTVIMNINDFERKEEELKLRAKILHAEQQRLSGDTMPFDEAMKEVTSGLDQHA